jgi:hypothetical protein
MVQERLSPPILAHYTPFQRHYIGINFSPRREYAPHTMSYTTNLTAPIENALRQVLQHDANTLARKTGFVQRQRKLTGSPFAQRMGFDAASNSCPTDTDWTQVAGRRRALIVRVSGCMGMRVKRTGSRLRGRWGWQRG